jgi:DNA-directed RNA polymerase specialized sigma24 family protein
MSPQPLPIRPLTCRPAPGQMFTVMDDGDEARRRRILADPAVHQAIRTVARLRGVSSDAVDDILGEVIEAALEDAKIPLGDDAQARLYLCGIARNKAIDLARERKRDADYNEAAQLAARNEAPGDPETKVHAWKLVEWGEKTFGPSFEWFLRHMVRGETHQAIAADVHVSPDHVRHTVATIRQRMHARMATLGVAVLLALVIGAMYARRMRHPELRSPGGDLATTASAPPRAPPVPSSASPQLPSPAESAAALRDRAKRELAKGQWDACVVDAQEAIAADPDGDTREAKDLLAVCVKKLMEPIAKPR